MRTGPLLPHLGRSFRVPVADGERHSPRVLPGLWNISLGQRGAEVVPGVGGNIGGKNVRNPFYPSYNQDYVFGSMDSLLYT